MLLLALEGMHGMLITLTMLTCKCISDMRYPQTTTTCYRMGGKYGHLGQFQVACSIHKEHIPMHIQTYSLTHKDSLNMLPIKISVSELQRV